MRFTMISTARALPATGGLISCGDSVTDAYHGSAPTAGRILKGAKPPDMPVDRATKFELVINLEQPGHSASKSRHPCSLAPTR